MSGESAEEQAFQPRWWNSSPRFGTKSVGRILNARRHRTLRYDDLTRMGASMKKAKAFVTLVGWTPGVLTDSADRLMVFSICMNADKSGKRAAMRKLQEEIVAAAWAGEDGR